MYMSDYVKTCMEHRSLLSAIQLKKCVLSEILVFFLLTNILRTKLAEVKKVERIDSWR